MPENLISLRRAAEIVGVHHSTLARAVERGEITSVTTTPGGWNRFSRPDIERYALRLDATKSVRSQIDAPSVRRALNEIPKLARALTGAQYAAVTVQATDGQPLRIYHDGFDDGVDWKSKPLPVGRGVLGKLGPSDAPLRLPNLQDHPDSEGLPDWHPPMEALLGVQISNNSGLKANLYLTNAPGGHSFTPEDEARLTLLSHFAQLALDSANLYERERDNRVMAESAERRLQAVIEESPVGVVIVDASTRKLIGSSQEARRICGHSLDVGMSLEDFHQLASMYDTNGRFVTGTERPIEFALVERKPTQSQDMLIETSDGSRVPVVISAAPIGTADGGIDSAVLIFHDTTHIHEVDNAKSEFLSMITHDLRSPLATIKGMAASLNVISDSGSEIQIGLNAIDEEVDHLTELVSNILDMSRIESGTRGVEREICHMTDIVQDALRRTLGSRHGFGRKVNVDVPTDLPEMYADPGQLGRVLDNLLSNALKYTPARVDIVSSYDSVTDTIRTEVADQGTGIPQSQREDIFDKFYRLREGKSRAREGSGLGLAICKSVVGAHGGNIGVGDNAGNGANFWFEIPRDPDQA